jgi:hypothetical protein
MSMTEHKTSASATSHATHRATQAAPTLPPAAMLHAVIVGAFGAAALIAPPLAVTPQAMHATIDVAPLALYPSVENLEPQMCQILVESEAGAALVLHRVGERGSDARSEAVTNAHGGHRFVDLTPGTYHLTAFFDGDIVAAAPVMRCDADTLRASVTITRPTVTAQLSGRVVGHDGAAPAGVEILIDQPEGTRTGLLGVAHVPVDANGAFSARLPEGQALVLAAAPHHLTSRTTVTLTSAAPKSTTVKLMWRPEARGRVIDASGAPVAGARISVGPVFDPKSTPATAVTNDDGTFTVDVVPGRPFTLTARAGTGIKTVSLDAVKQTAGVHDVELRLAEGRNVMGFVQDTKGGVRAFSDVLVRIRDLGIIDTVRTDGEGRFVVRAMPEDDVELWPKDGAIGAWGGAVADVDTRGVMLTYVPPAY